MPETRPTLDGLAPTQRTLAQAHWYVWRLSREQPTVVQAETVLGLLECHMQPETLHRLALARDRYWREKRQEDASGTKADGPNAGDVR